MSSIDKSTREETTSDLTAVPYVGDVRQHSFQQAGYETIRAIADSTVSQLAEDVYGIGETDARRIHEGALELLDEDGQVEEEENSVYEPTEDDFAMFESELGVSVDPDAPATTETTDVDDEPEDVEAESEPEVEEDGDADVDSSALEEFGVDDPSALDVDELYALREECMELSRRMSELPEDLPEDQKRLAQVRATLTQLIEVAETADVEADTEDDVDDEPEDVEVVDEPEVDVDELTPAVVRVEEDDVDEDEDVDCGESEVMDSHTDDVSEDEPADAGDETVDDETATDVDVSDVDELQKDVLSFSDRLSGVEADLDDEQRALAEVRASLESVKDERTSAPDVEDQDDDEPDDPSPPAVEQAELDDVPDDDESADDEDVDELADVDLDADVTAEEFDERLVIVSDGKFRYKVPDMEGIYLNPGLAPGFEAWCEERDIDPTERRRKLGVEMDKDGQPILPDSISNAEVEGEA